MTTVQIEDYTVHSKVQSTKSTEQIVDNCGQG